MSKTNNSFRVITIDGPAGTGKSSFAEILGKKLGFTVVNSGRMYRTIAWLCIKKNLKPENVEDIRRLFEENEIICKIKNRQAQMFINQKPAPINLNTAKINKFVSIVAKNPFIRNKLNELQRLCTTQADIICEGRDAGTVVFPKAKYKFFMQTPLNIREKRRAAQGFSDNLSMRDKIDSTRKESPLKIADDAQIIDNSEPGLDELLKKVLHMLKKMDFEF